MWHVVQLLLWADILAMHAMSNTRGLCSYCRLLLQCRDCHHQSNSPPVCGSLVAVLYLIIAWRLLARHCRLHCQVLLSCLVLSDAMYSLHHLTVPSHPQTMLVQEAAMQQSLPDHSSTDEETPASGVSSLARPAFATQPLPASAFAHVREEAVKSASAPSLRLPLLQTCLQNAVAQCVAARSGGRSSIRSQLRKRIVAACSEVFGQSAFGGAADSSIAMQVSEVLPKAFDALAAGTVPQADAFSNVILHQQAICPSQLHLSGLINRTMVVSGYTSGMSLTQQDKTKVFGVWLIANNHSPHEHVAVQMHELLKWSQWAQIHQKSMRVGSTANR